MKTALCVAALVTFVVGTNAAVYSDCGSTTGQFISATVSGCDESASRCIFKKGTDVTVNVKFKSLTATKSAKTVIHGVIGGVPLPFPFPQDDACQYGGIKCPLENGKEYEYKMTLPVETSYPSLDVDVEIELQDDAVKNVFCVKIPATLE